MGTLFLDEGPSQTASGAKKSREVAVYREMGCKICPLNKELGRMEPTGAPAPVIYCIGEAPGREEVEAEPMEQFIGESGRLLRTRIPRRWRDKIRWNNIVRSRPPRNRTPEWKEIEACRPSIVADIERTKPEYIFGFGNIPLQWFLPGFTGISYWRGRRTPIKVGNHTAWYYPMFHPSFLLRKGRGGDISEDERMWRFDLKRAFVDVERGLPEPVVHTPDMARANVEIVLNCDDSGLDRIAEFLNYAAHQPRNGVDYETSCLRPYEDGAKILSAAVSTDDHTLAFPFHHPEANWSQEHLDELYEIWHKYLCAPKVRRFVHNLAFEHEWSGYNFGEDVIWIGNWDDSSVQASILDERVGKNKPGCFSLEFLVQQHFGFNLKQLSNLDRKNLARTPLRQVLLYNGMDAKYHLYLGEVQEERIHEEGLDHVYWLALRRIPTVVSAQLKGIPVDLKANKELDEKYADRREDIEFEIAADPDVKAYERKKGAEFNPYSAPEVIKFFHDYLGFEECEVVDKYSKEDKLSADEDVLEQIDHPAARRIVALRKANKQHSTYIEPLDPKSPRTCLFPDGLLHPTYNTIFSRAGRLSAEHPNIQNQPKRDGEAREVRKQIVSAYLHDLKRRGIIIATDYGQIEARVIAMFTKDKRFCKALWERYDVHQEWAERLAHAYPLRIGGKKYLTDKKVMKDFRTDIKNEWTFPLFFGAKLESAAGYLGIPVEDLEPEFDLFWKQFSGVRDWQERQVKFYQEYGYVECLTGRRRRGPLSVNKIYNSPVQGTAADIVLEAWCRMYEGGDPELQPEIQVHDDLTNLRVDPDRVDIVLEKMLDTMLYPPFDWINVPITVEASMGLNWMPYDKDTNPDGLQEIGTFSSDTWRK